MASDPVISRLTSRLAADAPASLTATGKARAAARERACQLAGPAAPGACGGMVIADVDATLVTAHSEKEHAAPTWKKGFGLHPLTVFADHGERGNGEPLAITLRPGNAGSNTAADHVEAVKLALGQLPPDRRKRVLVRADSDGGTHEFLTWLTRPGRRLQYSVGFTITGDVAEAVARVPTRVWTPAYDSGGRVRDGAWVAELTGLPDLTPAVPATRKEQTQGPRNPAHPARQPGTQPPSSAEKQARAAGSGQHSKIKKDRGQPRPSFSADTSKRVLIWPDAPASASQDQSTQIKRP